jgi:hypothetical protein
MKVIDLRKANIHVKDFSVVSSISDPRWTFVVEVERANPIGLPDSYVENHESDRYEIIMSHSQRQLVAGFLAAYNE